MILSDLLKIIRSNNEIMLIDKLDNFIYEFNSTNYENNYFFSNDILEARVIDVDIAENKNGAFFAITLDIDY